MKFFFDENFPRAAAGLLGARGHEWADIRGTDQEGSDDTTICLPNKAPYFSLRTGISFLPNLQIAPTTSGN